MVCRQCGRTLPDKAKFCIGCGLPTQQAPSPQLPISPAARPEPLTPAPSPAARPEAEAAPARSNPYDALYYGTRKPVETSDVPQRSPQTAQPYRRPQQQPAYPPKQAAYPPQQAAYPPQPTAYPPQQAAWNRGGAYGQPQAGPALSGNPEGQNQVESRQPGVRRSAVPVGLRILSIFLCILLVAAGLAASALFALRWSYSPSQVKALVSSVDLREIEIPMEDGGTLKLIPFLENQAGVDLEKDYGITDREVDTLLDQPFVKDFVGGVAADYTDYLFFGASLNALTRNRVVDFFRENDRAIERYTGFSFREYENDLIYTADRYLEHYDLDRIFDNALQAREISEDYLKEKTGVDLDQIRSFLSTWIVVFSVIAIVLLILLIFLTLFRSPRTAIVSLGVSFAVLGALDLIASLAGRLWLNTQKIDLIKLAVEPFLSKLLLIGVCCLALGLVLIVIRLVLRKPVEQEI